MLPPVVADGKDGLSLDCILKNLVDFSKFSYPSYRQNQKCTMDYSSCKKIIDVLVLNFKAAFSTLTKVTKKDFCIVLAGKHQKCLVGVPLRFCFFLRFLLGCVFDDI